MKYVFWGESGAIWKVVGQAFFLLLAAYLIFAGVRGIEYGTAKPRTRYGWGRILVGSWLIYAAAQNHFHPDPNRLKPSNEAEALGMWLAAVVFVVIAILLIVSGLRARRKPIAVETDDSQTSKGLG